MSEWLQLCLRSSLTRSVIAALNEAEVHREAETRSVCVMQRVSRSRIQRSRFLTIRTAAIHIQRLWRGLKGRRLSQKKIKQAKNETEQLFKHHFATVIQKTWRGYRCRRFNANFYELKRYLRNVLDRNSIVKKEGDDYRTDQKNTESVRRIQTRIDELTKMSISPCTSRDDRLVLKQQIHTLTHHMQSFVASIDDPNSQSEDRKMSEEIREIEYLSQTQDERDLQVLKQQARSLVRTERVMRDTADAAQQEADDKRLKQRSAMAAQAAPVKKSAPPKAAAAHVARGSGSNAARSKRSQ